MLTKLNLPRLETFRGALAILACMVLSVVPVCAGGALQTASWDRSLPDLKLENVAISAESLEECWQQIGERFMVRSILVGANRTSALQPFSFQTNECRVRDLYDAIVKAYPEFTWSQDPATGVSWIYPKDIPFTQLLARPIKITAEALAIPMFSGILNPISSQAGSAIAIGKRGDAFTNSFNYPVNVSKGGYSLRELLQTCCLAHPKKTFSITLKSDSIIITPVNPTVARTHFYPPGAVLWWKTQIDPDIQGSPTDVEIIETLANPIPAKRTAARLFVDMMIMSLPFENWVREHPSEQKALWISLGILSFSVRDPGCNCILLDAIKRLETAANRPEFLKNESGGLPLLVAIELARDMQITNALEAMSKRELRKEDLKPIESDLYRLARTSKLVREFIVRRNPAWEGFSRKQITGMDATVVQLIPNKPAKPN